MAHTVTATTNYCSIKYNDMN